MRNIFRAAAWWITWAAITAAAPTLGGELALPRDDWDAAFQRAEGWTGGDAVYSVSLPGMRTLWLFADSWIGRVEHGRHADGSRLVNNALAIQARSIAGAAPRPDQLTFHWGPDESDRRPTAWLCPDASRVSAQLPRQALAGAATWYWVADGVVAPNARGSERLLIFLWHIGRTQGTGVWTFAGVGGALAAIENPHDDPGHWRIVQHENPHVVTEAAHELAPATKTVTWGCEVTLQPIAAPDSPGAAPWLYVFGTRQSGGWGVDLVLARAAADRVEHFDGWEFRSTDGWSPRLDQAATLAQDLVSEFSVTQVQLRSQQRWLLVQSQPLFGENVLVRVADAPHGPWSKPVVVYRVPNLNRREKHFTYAAKAHPESSGPGKLLVSYVVNSHDFAAAVNNADIYRPRFIEIDLTALADALEK